MSKITEFFETYPEAKDILPSPPELVEKWVRPETGCTYDHGCPGEGESKHPSLVTVHSFPSAQYDFSRWKKENITADESTIKNKKNGLAQHYIDLFNERISELLSFIGPKSTEARVEEILNLRCDFFAYPSEVEHRLLATYEQKQITDFRDIDLATLEQNDPFSNYFREIMVHFSEVIPFFDGKKHLTPHFSGFVRQVSMIREYSDLSTKTLFEAKGAYIRNGNIIWSIQDTGEPNFNTHSLVKWISGAYVLEEIYLNTLIRQPEGTPEPKVDSQTRKVKFQLDDVDITEVEVTQRLNPDMEEEFLIRITINHLPRDIVANLDTHPELVQNLKENPLFLSNIDNVRALLESVQS